jgi:hypothetical protein
VRGLGPSGWRGRLDSQPSCIAISIARIAVYHQLNRVSISHESDMPGRDLCLLSLDGGGIRGLSSLQILKQLMEIIGRKADLESPPKPCDYFDMIGGTSTGG